MAPDAEAMLGRIDAMVVAAATDVHAEMMHLAAEAGLPVFCEKPIATDLPATDDGGRAPSGCRCAGPDRISATVRRGLPRAPRIWWIRELLGTCTRLRTTTHDYEPPPPGYHDTGIYRDTQIHDFDIVRYVTGQEVVEVYADGSTPSPPRSSGTTGRSTPEW